MNTLTDFMIFFTIAITFIALFVLPFFYIIHKIFINKSKIVKFYISMIIGIFCSIALVIFLVNVKFYTPISFLICYLAIVIPLNLFFLYKSKWSLFSEIGSYFKLNKLSFTSIKNVIKSPIFILLFLALAIGFYTRMSYSFLHLSLTNIDPYGHLLISKLLAEGVFIQQVGYYDYNVRGFHAIVTLLHFYSPLDLYSIQRFLGGFLGILSIGSIYCLVTSIKDRFAGAFAAVIYSGIVIIPEIHVLIVRQTQSIPEVLGLVILPITILAIYEFITNLNTNSNNKAINKFSFLFLITFVSLWYIHPYTLLMTIHLSFLLMIIGAIYYKKYFIIFIMILTTVLIFLFSNSYVANTFKFYSLARDWVFFDLFVFKGEIIPTFTTLIIFGVSTIFLTYGLFVRQIARRISIIFVSSASILFGIIETTGLLTTILPLSRVMPFFAITVACLIGVLMSEVFYGIDSEAYRTYFKRSRYKYFSNTTQIKTIMGCTIIAILLLFIPTSPPTLSHFGYEESVEVTLDITDDFPEKETKIYSEKLYLINREQAIIEPEGSHDELHDLIRESPINYAPKTNYTFIFIEKKPYAFRAILDLAGTHPTNIMNNGQRWVEEYQVHHSNVEIYHETENIIVYLINTKENILLNNTLIEDQNLDNLVFPLS